MRIRLRGDRREDGAVAIIVAFLAVVLVALAAFTTDFGMAYSQRQALATGADSAALAIIHAEYNKQLTSPARTCAQAKDQYDALDTNGFTKAENIAYAQVNANAPFKDPNSASEVIPHSGIITTLSCVDNVTGVTPITGTVLKATVTVNRSITSLFGGVVGVSQQHIDRTAVAALGVVNGVTNAMPIAVCTSQAQAIIAGEALKAGSAQLIPLDKVWPTGATPCAGTGGSGNWGWLDFGEGVSVQNLKDYISGTYKTTITIDNSTKPPSATMDGTPGNKGNADPVVTAMQTFIDKGIPAIFPVYSTVGAGHGSGTTYNVIGFLSVMLCGISSNSKQAVAACYDSTTPGVQLVKDDMQVKYVEYTPVAQMGELCSIGSITCASPNTYVTKLLG